MIKKILISVAVIIALILIYYFLFSKHRLTGNYKYGKKPRPTNYKGATKTGFLQQTR